MKGPDMETLSAYLRTRKFKPEKIISKLREAEVMLGLRITAGAKCVAVSAWL